MMCESNLYLRYRSCFVFLFVFFFFFFFSSRRRHTRCGRDWSSDVCSSDLSLKALKASGGQESAKEQPAFKSGKTTVLLGFKILAVSAIKCTPANTIIQIGRASCRERV